MTTNACPHTVTVGSYLLGMLCTQEADEFGQHAEMCPYCRREIDELTPSAHLLQVLRAETRPAGGHNRCVTWPVSSAHAIHGSRRGAGCCRTSPPTRR
jgi:hypothetical protein